MRAEDDMTYLQLRRAFALLKEGLGPYLLLSYRDIYGHNWRSELEGSTRSFKSLHIADDDWTLDALDTQGQLDLILKRREVFNSRLGRVGIAYATELLEARNGLAHERSLSWSQVVRVFETVSLMLGLIGASDLAAEAAALSAKIQSNVPLTQTSSAKFATELREQMALVSRTIDALTQDQYRILEWMRGFRRASISGCAGSGKTLVALEKSIRLEKAGLQVLLLCHNPFLAERLRFLTSRTTIRVHDFSQWVSCLIDNPRQKGRGIDWVHYDEPIEEEIALAMFRLSTARVHYDAVIVDEGQDFRDSWWSLVECAFENPERAILYVFHDDNQALLPLRSTYPASESPYSLSKNCRNVGAVFDIVRQLHRQAPEPSTLLANLGSAKRTVFSGDGEFDAMKCAVIDALSILSPDRLIVLSSEAVAPRESALTGLTVTVPSRWKWQDVVARSLLPLMRRYGSRKGPLGQPQPLPLPEVSTMPRPTECDIAAVTGLARRLGQRVTGFDIALRDSYRVHWREEPDGPVISNARGPHAALAFFASGRWAEGLPQPWSVVLGKADSCETTIPIWTTSTFKGLESDGVVLFLRRSQHSFDASVYVAVSRARLYLNVVAEAGTLSRLPCFSRLPDTHCG